MNKANQTADSELNQLPGGAGEHSDGLKVPLRINDREASVHVSGPLLQLARALRTARKPHDAEAALRKADRELEPWRMERRESTDRFRVALPCGVEVDVPSAG